MNRTGTVTIETRRLILRRFTAEDAEDMYANWASDPEVTRYLTWPPHPSVDVTRSLLADWVARYEDGAYFNWAIELKETGKAIGNISVVRLDERTAEAEMGYCMSRAYWGRGIMPEALRAVMDYLFHTVGVERITARHDAENPKSGRVMAKAGMKPIGTLKGNGHNNRGVIDEVYYAARKDEQVPEEAASPAPVKVRFAAWEDLPRVNELRREVSVLHAAGKPEIFKPGFPDELRDYVFAIWDDPGKEIVVAESNGTVCGFAVLAHVDRPETPFMFERDYLDIDELDVDENYRRQGVGTAMLAFIRDWAKEKGFSRVELNMWSFNREALAFYESAGYVTYRRYMELKLR